MRQGDPAAEAPDWGGQALVMPAAGAAVGAPGLQLVFKLLAEGKMTSPSTVRRPPVTAHTPPMHNCSS